MRWHLLGLWREKSFSLITELEETWQRLISRLGAYNHEAGTLQPFCYQEGNQPKGEANTKRKKIWETSPGDIIWTLNKVITVPGNYQQSFQFPFKKKKVFINLFLEKGKGGQKRGRETSMCERHTDWLPLARTPTRDLARNLGTCPTRNHTDDLFQFAGWHPTHWATPVGASFPF